MHPITKQRTTVQIIQNNLYINNLDIPEFQPILSYSGKDIQHVLIFSNSTGNFLIFDNGKVIYLELQLGTVLPKSVDNPQEIEKQHYDLGISYQNMVSRPSLHREETFLLIPGNNHTELGLYYLNLEPNHKRAKKIEEIKQKNHKRDYGAFLNYIFALFIGQNIFMTINNTKGVNLFYFDSQGFEFVKFYNFESQVKG